MKRKLNDWTEDERRAILSNQNHPEYSALMRAYREHNRREAEHIREDY